jgi:hypothetical protein
VLGLSQAGDLVFNCQMGRGRTTTGMVCADLVASVLYGDYRMQSVQDVSGGVNGSGRVDGDGLSEEEAYLNGTLGSLFGISWPFWRFCSL